MNHHHFRVDKLNENALGKKKLEVNVSEFDSPKIPKVHKAIQRTGMILGELDLFLYLKGSRTRQSERQVVVLIWFWYHFFLRRAALRMTFLTSG